MLTAEIVVGGMLITCVILQVRNDYLRNIADTIDLDTALRLGCIEMRRLFKNMAPEALLKKTNMDYIERVGLTVGVQSDSVSTRSHSNPGVIPCRKRSVSSASCLTQ